MKKVSCFLKLTCFVIVTACVCSIGVFASDKIVISGYGNAVIENIHLSDSVYSADVTYSGKGSFEAILKCNGKNSSNSYQTIATTNNSEYYGICFVEKYLCSEDAIWLEVTSDGSWKVVIENLSADESDLEEMRVLYNEFGKNELFNASQTDAKLKEGWYTEPVQRLYAPGKSAVFKKAEVEAQLTVGWYTEPLVLLYAPGKSKYFKESQVAAQLTVGWYTEPVQILYAPGKSAVFKKTDVAAQLTVGWYTEPVQILYAPGKSAVFKKSEVAAQLTVGWYTEPVQRLYLPGKSAVFKKTEVEAQLKVGWSTEPYVLLYAPGKSKYFKESQVAAQLTVGWYTEPLVKIYSPIEKSKYVVKSELEAYLKSDWYTEPVQRLYAPGKSKYFKESQVAAQLTVGWYTDPYDGAVGYYSKHSVKIMSTDIYMNSEDGASPSISIRNDSGRIIRCLYLDCTSYNSQDEQVNCKIRNTSKATVQTSGPIYPESAEYRPGSQFYYDYGWNYVWYDEKSDLNYIYYYDYLYNANKINLTEKDLKHTFTTTCYFEPAWYNSDISYFKINKLKIVYTDGTTETINNPPVFKDLYEKAGL